MLLVEIFMEARNTVFNSIINKMTTINITVILKAKEELTEKVKSTLEGLVKNATTEPGCLQYKLYQGAHEGSVFVLHETWENQEAFETHNKLEYVKDFFAIAPTLLRDKPEVIFTNLL